MLASALSGAAPRRGFAKMGPCRVHRIASGLGWVAGFKSDRRIRQAPGAEDSPVVTPGSSMKFSFFPRAASPAAMAGRLCRTAALAALLVLTFFGAAVYAQQYGMGENSGQSPRHARSAKSSFKHGQQAEARQDYDTAFSDYQAAYEQDPSNIQYRTAYYRVRVTDGALH